MIQCTMYVNTYICVISDMRVGKDVACQLVATIEATCII
jgi:hypothetical protein